jgi:hypothetical protein
VPGSRLANHAETEARQCIPLQQYWSVKLSEALELHQTSSTGQTLELTRKKSLIVYLNSKMDNADTVFAYFVNCFIEQIGSKGNASDLHLRAVQSEFQRQH